MDKRLFKRLCRGLGLPVVDWREVRAARWAADPAAVPRRARRVRRRRRRPAPDGQAGAARVVGRDDPRPRPRGAAGGARAGVPLRHPRPRRDLPRRRARPRGRGHRQRPALELYGPGEIVSGHEFYDYAAKYTPGLSETSTAAEVSRRPAGDHPQDRARRVPGDRREGFARVDFLLAGERIFLSEINTIPGFTPISLFPTMPSAGGYTFADVCERIVELALERARRPRHRPPQRRRTCRDEPPSGRPAARRRWGRAAGHRASGARRRRGSRRSGPAPRSPCSRGRGALYGVGASSSAFDYAARPAHGRRRLHRPRGGRGRPRRRPRPEPVPPLDRSARGRARGAPDRRARPRRRRAARHAGRDARRARPDPRLAGRRPALLADADGNAVRRAAGRARRGDGRPAGRRRRRGPPRPA